jgi:hypothetical protein
VQEDGDGHTYLKIEPLHAPSLVYETGDSDPTSASSPVPTPTRFEAVGLRYRFLAFDPADMVRVSAVKEWTAKLRLKYQLHHRGNSPARGMAHRKSQRLRWLARNHPCCSG